MARHLKLICFWILALLLVSSSALSQSTLQQAFVSQNGQTIVPLGYGFIAVNPTRNVAINGSCVTSLDCRPGLHCTADDNGHLRYLQATAALSARVGHCIDTTGLQDSAPGLQADILNLPQFPTTGVWQNGTLYNLPPSATLLINSAAGWPATTRVVTGCSTTAGSINVDCPIVDTFVSMDVDQPITITGAGDGGIDLVTSIASAEETPPLAGERIFLATPAVTTNASATLTWTQRSVGLLMRSRINLAGNGSVLKISNSLKIGLEIDVNYIGNPHADGSNQYDASRSYLHDFTVRPVTLTTNLNWGLRASAYALSISRISIINFGRCLDIAGGPQGVWIADANFVEDIIINGCYGYGIYDHGADSNISLFMLPRVRSGVGIKADGYLGNVWLAAYSEGNTLVSNDPVELTNSPAGVAAAHSFSSTSAGTGNVIIGMYKENIDPAPDLDTSAKSSWLWAGGGVIPQIPSDTLQRVGAQRTRLRFRDNTSGSPNGGYDVTIPGIHGTSSDYAMFFMDRGTAHGGTEESFGWSFMRTNGEWGIQYQGQAAPQWFGWGYNPGEMRVQGAAWGPAWGYPAINHGSIGSLAVLEATGTVASVSQGAGVVCTPNVVTPSGLFVSHARVSAQDTVTVGIGNPTGGAVDPASLNYVCRGGVIQAALSTTVVIDHGSIAAQDNLAATATFTGIQPNDVVWCSPRSGFTAGVAYSGARASATDTLSVTLGNMTAGAVDPASVTYDCWGGGTQNAIEGSASVNHGSIAAGGVLEATLGSTGASAARMVSVCSPRSALPTGLMAARARPSGGLVSIPLVNLTPSPIDPAAITWDCRTFKY